MTQKYEIHIDNGRMMYRYDGGMGTIEHLKDQLIYDMQNGIIAEVRGIILEPTTVIETDEDIYNIFFKNAEDGEVIRLTDYLAGKIQIGRGARVGKGFISVIMHGKECRFTNDHLKGGLPVSTETMLRIDGICEMYEQWVKEHEN